MALLVSVARLPREGAPFHLQLTEEELLQLAESHPLPLGMRVTSACASLFLRREGLKVVYLRGELQLTYSGLCGRCLTPIGDTLTLTLERKFRPLLPFSSPSRERESWDEEFLKEWEEEEEYEGELLDLSAWVREEVLLALPEHPLCKGDCQGLCPICGENRNEVHCRCLETSRTTLTNPLTFL